LLLYIVDMQPNARVNLQNRYTENDTTKRPLNFALNSI